MTDKTEAQPEALRLAEFFESLTKSSHRWWDGVPVHEKAATVLRDQATEIQQLKAQLNDRGDYFYGWGSSLQVFGSHQSIKALKAQLSAKTSSCMGVGDGGGELFVYGNHESIKAAQALVLRAEKISGLEAELTKQTNRSAAAEQQVTTLTQRLDMANRLNTDAREQLAQLSARQAAPVMVVTEAMHVAAVKVLHRANGVDGLPQRMLDAMLSAAPPPPEREPKCWCETCRPNTPSDMRFIVCPDCGNKRCPKATHHDNACTNSNAPGQPGSSWEHVKPHGATNDNP